MSRTRKRSNLKFQEEAGNSILKDKEKRKKGREQHRELNRAKV
jgi:hypothetical protein